MQETHIFTGPCQACAVLQKALLHIWKKRREHIWEERDWGAPSWFRVRINGESTAGGEIEGRFSTTSPTLFIHSLMPQGLWVWSCWHAQAKEICWRQVPMRASNGTWLKFLDRSGLLKKWDLGQENRVTISKEKKNFCCICHWQNVNKSVWNHYFCVSKQQKIYRYYL